MDIELKDAIQKLYEKYSKYGVDEAFSEGMIRNGLDMGMSVRTSYNIARAAIGRFFGEEEVYDIDDFLDAMEIDPEEAEKEPTDSIWGNLSMTLFKP